ncbi:ERCC4 domain-containing protein [Acidobacteriota bacterium]
MRKTDFLQAVTAKKDTREGDHVYDLKPMREVVDTCQEGDYQLLNSDLISLERKTLPDLIGSISRERARLERELKRLRQFQYRALIIEASMEDILQHRYRSQMESHAVIQSLCAFSIRYGLPVWFCGDRRGGEYITKSLLLKMAREQFKNFTAITTQASTTKDCTNGY